MEKQSVTQTQMEGLDRTNRRDDNTLKITCIWYNDRNASIIQNFVAYTFSPDKQPIFCELKSWLRVSPSVSHYVTLSLETPGQKQKLDPSLKTSMSNFPLI